MWLKLKKMGCCLLIIVLLPYVVTVFINGPSITAQSRVDQTYIQVKMSGEKAEEGQVIEMPLEDYESALWQRKFRQIMKRRP